MPLGEYLLKPMLFCGHDRTHAKRKALDFWYRHRSELGITLRDFLRRCTLSHDERTITYFP